ncbi:hypothetical protein BpHYR1_053153 [Brachionus plicatilis]|uniref:Uncharacterized protein n=1 Tax=Brachionus plicatilis TaxID=10195 RepID=A0A3M7QC31_BRAPC|nr:hypothetical protein BpHYR1_053153 [Brachionus plicatilis]
MFEKGIFFLSKNNKTVIKTTRGDENENQETSAIVWNESTIKTAAKREERHFLGIEADANHRNK